jgi:hypothetical protein
MASIIRVVGASELAYGGVVNRRGINLGIEKEKRLSIARIRRGKKSKLNPRADSHNQAAALNSRAEESKIPVRKANESHKRGIRFMRLDLEI